MKPTKSILARAKNYLVAASLWLVGSVPAASLLQEGFNYPAGTLGNNPPWTGATSLIMVSNVGQTFPNLADFSPPSFCAAVAPGSTAVSYRPLNNSASSGVVYFSLLINFISKPGSYYIAGLLQSTNAPPGGAAADPLDLIDNTSGTGYKLGVRAKGGTTSYVANSLVPMSTNTTYFVVMKYDFSSGQASLYLNPPPGGTEPATPDATSTAATTVPDLSFLYLRAGSSSAGNFLISTLRVATTWNEATPAASAPLLVSSNTITANGAMLNAFLDSLQVDKFWLVGTSVNWLTGVPGGNGPNMTLGTDSHCSAFAPAAAELLGVYLLRPPDASDLNLANNQADWFVTNAFGWFPITTGMTNVQHMVNTGLLVMASYKAASGSGHIAVLRASTRTDADVNAYGPEECQSGTYNFADTNIITGFNQHPGAFPNNIKYYGHNVNYPVSPTWPWFGTNAVANQNFKASMTTIIGRAYQLQASSNLVNWTPLLNFTNSNIPATFFTNSTFSDVFAGDRQKFYRIQPQ